MLAVPIQEKEIGIVFGSSSLQASFDRSALPQALAMTYHGGPGRSSSCACIVQRIVINHDHPLDVSTHTLDHSSNEPFLFMRRDDGTDCVGSRFNHELAFRISCA